MVGECFLGFGESGFLEGIEKGVDLNKFNIFEWVCCEVGKFRIG